jgi:hypothetical protein
MKYIFLAISALLAATLGMAQVPPKIATPEQRIETILDTGMYEGHDQKIIGGLGDKAAVMLTRVVGERSLSSKQIDSLLLILNWAFSGVRNSAESQPRTALFVLRYLDLQAPNAKTRADISKTRKFIMEQSKNRTKP